MNFFTIFASLKNSINYYFHKEEVLSFALSNDIEKHFQRITSELYIEYEELQSSKTNLKDNYSNLLIEYKKAVDLSNIVSKTNPKGIITYVNDKFCEISGYKKRS